MKAMNKLLKTSLVALLFVVAATATANGQRWGIKSNVLYWAAGGTINFAVEAAVAPKMTVELGLTGNPWYFGPKSKNKKIWHWTAQPEVRFWHAEAFNRGFVGLHVTTGSFDAGGIKLPLGLYPGLANHRYEAWMVGVGASYGWQWYLGPHWNLEATFGFGYLYIGFNRFECGTCDARDMTNAVKHYFGPTKVGVSFQYLFRSKK